MWYEAPSPSRWSTPYVFLAGLVVGVIIGWMFQGFIGMLVRLALLALVVGAVVLAVNLWRKSNAPKRSPYDDIPEADWRDMDSSRRR
ncbi:hypothetical protein BH23CHL5_BH23CHL5_21570 [soil metagenome]